MAEPASVRSLPALTVADAQIATGNSILMGLAVNEDAAVGAAAAFILRDGTSTAGAIVIPVELAANGSIYLWFGPEGVRFKTGIFLDMIAGSISGSILLQ